MNHNYVSIRLNHTNAPRFVLCLLPYCEQIIEQVFDFLILQRYNCFTRFIYHSTLAINGDNGIFSMVIRVKAESAHTIIILRFNDNSSIGGFITLFAIT